MLKGLFFSAAFLVLGAPALAEQCVLQHFIDVDAGVDGSEHVFVPATLAGKETRLMIDTGGYWSLIRKSMAQTLNLREHKMHSTYFTDGVGGMLRSYVSIPDVSIHGVHWGKVDFVIMPGENPDSDPARVAGTLGLNFLRNFDLEVDSAKKKLKFFLPNKCDEMGPYWSDEFVSFPIALREGALPIAKAQLDNEDIRVILDTGSSVSWLSLDVARRHFGLTPESPGVIKRGEIVMPSGKKVTTYAYTFGALTLSGIRFENVPIELGDFDHAELVLGMHELRHLRLYFAFKSGVVYATAADAGQSP